MKQKLNLFQILGFLLILSSLGLLLGSKLVQIQNNKTTAQIRDTLEAMLPEPMAGNPADYSEADMPVFQLEGEDFSGLVSFPAYSVSLPIGSNWDSEKLSVYPCRYWGSAYDCSMVIGGSDKEGQFGLCGRLDLGDKVVITDVIGVQFTYEVARIDRYKQADEKILLDEWWDLTLFVKDTGAGTYIVVRCLLTA